MLTDGATCDKMSHPRISPCAKILKNLMYNELVTGWISHCIPLYNIKAAASFSTKIAD